MFNAVPASEADTTQRTDAHLVAMGQFHQIDGQPWWSTARLELPLACATVFLAPMNALRLPDYYLTVADVFALLTICVMVAGRGIPVRPLGALTPLYLLGVLMLAVGLLVSSAINGDAWRGLIGVLQYLYAFLIFAVVLIREDRKEAMIVAYVFAASILTVCLHGIVVTLFDLDPSGAYVTASGRLRGLVQRENEMAALLAMSTPLVLWLIGEGKLSRISGWSAILIILYTITLTGSNSGLYTFVIAMVTMIFASRTALDALVPLILGCLVVISLSVFGEDFLPAVFRKRVLEGLTTGELEHAGTFSYRHELLIESLTSASSNLLIGMGMDQYRAISAHGAPVHNAYALILNEGGAIALFGLVLLMLTTAAPAALMLVSDRVRTGVYLLSTVLLFALAIGASAHVYGRFWFLTCLVALGIALTEDPDRSPA